MTIATRGQGITGDNIEIEVNFLHSKYYALEKFPLF